MAASHGIIIKQYHADNGIFRANAWAQDCQERANPQLTTYAGLNAHHTNGLAESRTRNIQENGRAMMLHVQQKFPEAIADNLWPYALRHVKNSYNATPFLEHHQGLSPLQIFTGTQAQYNPNHCRPFGFPKYVLNESLCSSQRIHHKWKNRSKVGV